MNPRPHNPCGCEGGESCRPLGWHVISGEALLTALWRCQQGETASLVFAELWANADHEQVQR